MYKFTWISKTIKTNLDAEIMRGNFRNTKHAAAAFDTETTGLNPVRDKPFLFQFGWIDTDTMKGYTYVVDIERQPILANLVIRVWHALVKTVPKYVGHHVVFDLHMITNIGLPYREPNISDTQAYIRLGTDAKQVKKGGAPLKLKEFSKMFIDRRAAEHEQILDREKSKIASEYNLDLKSRLGWTKKKIDEFFKDKMNDVDDLPEDKRATYLDWKSSLPLYLQQKVTGAVEPDMIRYDKLDRDMVTEYGHQDIILTLEVWYLMQAALHARGNELALKIEEDNLYPIYDMERVGFEADKEYILEAKQKTKEYILSRREDLKSIAGCEVSVGQHALIKKIISTLGLEVTSTGNDELELVVSELERSKENPAALEFIQTVQELRTLEKWYSTYICRFLYELQFGNILYTSINPFGAVSGRVTSDFQQFPKGAITTVDGVELFKPRRMIKVTQGYKGIVYLDYSQVELRLQAMYTILVGSPDLNLCRAYMPYECFTKDQQGNTIPFDCHSKWCIKHSYDVAWYYKEEPTKQWTPLDVHGATTKHAFHIDESDPRFHDLRYVGKRVNFAKNYGAQRGKIRQMFPHFTEEEIDDIDSAYYAAFPGVKKYHEYCYAIAIQQTAVQNLFGVKYYNVSGHNLINMLVQGSGAYLLKKRIYEVNKYLREHNAKSKLQMQIHDELSFLWHPDDPPEMWFEIKEILQDWEDGLVPIISDMEVTYTNWAEKVEVESIEQLRGCVENGKA